MTMGYPIIVNSNLTGVYEKAVNLEKAATDAARHQLKLNQRLLKSSSA